MEAGAVARILVLVQVLAVLGLAMAGFSLILNRKREGGSLAAAVVRAVVLTLCAVLVDGVTLIRRPAFADNPRIWILAAGAAVGALLGWINVGMMRRKKGPFR